MKYFVGCYRFLKNSKLVVKTNFKIFQVKLDMILPVVNMDVTPLVQFLVFVSYLGLVYGLSAELIGGNPLRMLWRDSDSANPTVEIEIPEENTVSD